MFAPVAVGDGSDSLSLAVTPGQPEETRQLLFLLCSRPILTLWKRSRQGPRRGRPLGRPSSTFLAYPGCLRARFDRGCHVNDDQFEKMKSGQGFIAALDQSGGSTPKALRLYGIGEDQYADDDEMFALMHAMRSRIIESPSFDGDVILGAILFEDTMDREIAGRASVSYVWDVKHVVPFLKVDKGLAAEQDGVQVMRPIPGLASLLARAKENGVFGTKMRSFIKQGNPVGIKAVVDRQFSIAREILATGLIPIIEPEVDIHSPEKGAAEELLKTNVAEQLAQLESGRCVVLKFSLPDVADFYADLVRDPKVLRVVALSGGYDRKEADKLLAANHGVIASFSRPSPRGCPSTRPMPSSMPLSSARSRAFSPRPSRKLGEPLWPWSTAAQTTGGIMPSALEARTGSQPHTAQAWRIAESPKSSAGGKGSDAAQTSSQLRTYSPRFASNALPAARESPLARPARFMPHATSASIVSTRDKHSQPTSTLRRAKFATHIQQMLAV